MTKSGSAEENERRIGTRVDGPPQGRGEDAASRTKAWRPQVTSPWKVSQIGLGLSGGGGKEGEGLESSVLRPISGASVRMGQSRPLSPISPAAVPCCSLQATCILRPILADSWHKSGTIAAQLAESWVCVPLTHGPARQVSCALIGETPGAPAGSHQSKWATRDELLLPTQISGACQLQKARLASTRCFLALPRRRW